MKKNTSWKFTDESSVTFQSSLSGAGEFGPSPIVLPTTGGPLIVWKMGLGESPHYAKHMYLQYKIHIMRIFTQ